MRFTVQERNLVCIYHSGSREDTIAQIREAIPYIDTPDVLASARSAIWKLETMNGAEFTLLVYPEAAS